jgi:NAD(P)-dependent dehydrogenase (short-subunit alcohol dehydrogenase family)
MHEFTGKVALITGAGSGIGGQLSRMLLREGAAVGGIDMNAAGLSKLATEFAQARLATATGDVTSRASLHAAVIEITSKLGPIDVLVACAGVGFETSALAFKAEDFEAIVRVNLIGVANSVAEVLPSMLERRSGHLVGLSSLASYRGLPGMLGYCASKSGVNALFEGLRAELAPHGIAATTICPGWIRTPMTDQVRVPPSQIMDLAVAGEQIMHAIRAKVPFFAFPKKAAREVGLLRWLPSRISDSLTNRRMRDVIKH